MSAPTRLHKDGLRPPWFFHGMALITVILWSFSYIHIIWLSRLVTPAQLVVLRFEFSALALVGILLWRRPKLSMLTPKDWLLIIAIGLASGPVYHYVLAWGAAGGRIDAALLGLIIATIPIYVGVLAWVFLGERPTLRRAVGLTLGVAGVAIVVLGRIDEQHHARGHLSTMSTLIGPIAVTIAAIIAAMNTVMSRAARHALGPVDLTAVTGLIALAVCFAMHPFAHMGEVLSMPWQGWWAAFYLGFIAIGLANLSWYAAVSGLQAGSVAMYLFVPSILSALWAWLWQNNHIGWAYIAGSMLVLLGLLVGASSSSRTVAASPDHDEAFEESVLT